MTPARRGEWWLSDKGAVYCVDGVGWGEQGQSARVRVWWITNHDPPQVHRLHLYLNQWRSLTTKGKRIDGPPSHNNKGCSFGPAVAQVRELLGAT